MSKNQRQQSRNLQEMSTLQSPESCIRLGWLLLELVQFDSVRVLESYRDASVD